jgi:DNA-binding transcriptional ArsR family regulator
MADTSRTDEVFSALAAPARREMLELLARRETPVMELAERFDMTLSAVSQHLAILRDAGLVTQRKEGRQRLYRLSPEPLQAVSNWLRFYEPFWSDRFERLGHYLDENSTEENA